MPLDLARLKLDSEAALSAKGINVIAHLPQIEGLEEVTPKNAQTVARRVCAINYLVGLGYGAKKRKLRKWLKGYKLWPALTESERKSLRTFSISEQEKANYQWMDEAAQALAWSLGLLEMDHFKPCDFDLIAKKTNHKSDPTVFIKSSQLRPVEDIQKEVDLLYRMHWYAKRGQTAGKHQLTLSIILERRRAIDWVYGTAIEWYDIDLST